MKSLIHRKTIEKTTLVEIKRYGTQSTKSSCSPTEGHKYTHFYRDNGTRNDRRIRK
jgi:hypothetical protein